MQWSVTAPFASAAKFCKWNGSKIAGISNKVPPFTGLLLIQGKAIQGRQRSPGTPADTLSTDTALGPALWNHWSISRISLYLLQELPPIRHQSLVENRKQWRTSSYENILPVRKQIKHTQLKLLLLQSQQHLWTQVCDAPKGWFPRLSPLQFGTTPPAPP